MNIVTCGKDELYIYGGAGNIPGSPGAYAARLTAWPGPPPPARPTHVTVPVGFNYKDTKGAFKTMNDAMTENPPGLPPGIDQTELLKLFATVGVGPNESLAAQSQETRKGLERGAERGLELLQKMNKGRGKIVNGWTYPPPYIGRAGQHSDFITRAAVQALAGIAANDAAEAVYLNMAQDDQGEPLDSKEEYTIQFGPSELPPYDHSKHGFWSITMYDSSYNLVPNRWNIYSVNSYDSPWVKDYDPAEGLTIYVQRTRPDSPEQRKSWLPSPRRGRFFLILRVYLPGPEVSTTQTWQPPSLKIAKDV